AARAERGEGDFLVRQPGGAARSAGAGRRTRRGDGVGRVVGSTVVVRRRDRVWIRRRGDGRLARADARDARRGARRALDRRGGDTGILARLRLVPAPDDPPRERRRYRGDVARRALQRRWFTRSRGAALPRSSS